MSLYFEELELSDYKQVLVQAASRSSLFCQQNRQTGLGMSITRNRGYAVYKEKEEWPLLYAV